MARDSGFYEGYVLGQEVGYLETRSAWRLRVAKAAAGLGFGGAMGVWWFLQMGREVPPQYVQMMSLLGALAYCCADDFR